MSKKGFKSQASSGRAISGAGGFGSGFGTSTFQTYSSPLSYVYEPPDLSGLSDANVGVYFKNLMKKDVTTKAKALEELEAYIKPAEVQIEETFLSAWVREPIALPVSNGSLTGYISGQTISSPLN